ncbi:MAG TPA: hypothetical protein VLB27_05245 [candidate division Zixibacteria bacterium]|nr:hypothetical protein [candidate division Zixibacteria bacterium]
MTFVEHLEIWIIAFVTLSLFSFLYKDNPFYKFAEHIFAGLSAGYYAGLIAQSVIYTMLVDPLITDFTANFLLIIPMGLGVLMLTRLTPIGPIPNIAWLSRWGLALVIGTTAGIFIVSQLHGLVMPQTLSTFRDFRVDGTGEFIWYPQIVIFISVLATLVYFYFSKEHKGVIGGVARLGIWCIMIAFGAQFGYTVMGRVSLLIGRMQFLIEDWISGSIGSLFG